MTRKLDYAKPKEFKGYRTQAELADYLGVVPRTVRYWRVAGKIPEPYVMPNGWAVWSPEQVREIRDKRLQEQRKRRKLNS